MNMKIEGLKDLQREEGQIFYLRKYKCKAVVNLPIAKEEVPIHFTIEMNPLGQKNIDLTIEKQINYPLLPLKKAITDFILTEELEGRLPC